MSRNLFQYLSKKTKQINQDVFGVPFRCIAGTDGEWISVDAESGGELLTLQIVYNTVSEDAVTGADVFVETPNITISNRSLDPMPKSGETWFFELPVSPMDGADKKIWKMSRDSILNEGVLGVSTIYMEDVEQSEVPV